MGDINFDDVDWEKEGSLYRGTFECTFENRVLESLRDGQKPLYWGTVEDGEKITYCSPLPGIAASMIEMRREPRMIGGGYGGHPENWPFSNYTLLMEIDANTYRDKLRWDSDGIAIEGPINPNDITILFSSHINLLNGEVEVPHVDYTKNAIESALATGRLSPGDLVDSFDQDSELVARALLQQAHGPRVIMSCSRPEEDELVEKVIETLRKKLRPE